MMFMFGSISVIHSQEPAKVAPKPATQNPSPMVEHTRSHPRLKEERPAGSRILLLNGTLFLPEELKRVTIPLYVHFHGGTWLPEVAAAKHGYAVISVQLGSGSGTYGKPFLDPERFGNLLKEAEEISKRKFSTIGLSGWSAGYGAIREILKQPKYFEKVDWIILLDGLHAGYVKGSPGPKESELITDDLKIFLEFAKAAVEGKKRFLLTHTEIFPGTFASTTETTDYLLNELKLKRQALLKWGPMGTQQLGEVKKGGFDVQSFAGNSAPDHVDLLHALPDFLKLMSDAKK
jgi:hypothetical protein